MTCKRNARLNRSMMGAASALALALAISTTAHAQPEGVRTFNIEAQPLSEALLEFSRQSEVNVIAPSSVTRGLTSQPVSGELAPQDALKAMLGDASLDVKVQPNGSIVLAQYTAEAPADSRDGPFRLAQLDQEDDRDVGRRDDEKDEGAPEEIIVTGTNIRGVQIASPVTVISKEDIDLSGVATVGELLEQIPQNFGGGLNEDGTSTANSNGVSFSGKSTVNLRGLGASATLVLFNGRRLAAAGFESQVDVSLIPLSAVDRVEVLTDGASAIYGSDAVAGVVNFVLSRDYEGAETRLRYGAVTDGGLKEYRAVQTVGKNWDNSNVLASYQYFKRGDLRAVEREQTIGAAFEGAPNRDEIDILPEQESHSFLFSGAHAFSPQLSLEGDFVFSSRKAKYDETFVTSFDLTPVDRDSRSNQYAATLAAFYEIDTNWEFEIAGVYGSNNVVSDNNRPSLGSFMRNLIDSELWSLEPKVTGSLLALPAGELMLAVGGQYREESFLGQSDEGTIFSEGERSVLSAYGEARIPVFSESNAIAGFQQLELSLAVRHEHYSDFGDTTDPKLGVIWSPLEDLMFRGTWGTSFKAPTLDQLDFDPADQVALLADFADPTMSDGITTGLLELGSVGDQLRPETSTAYTVGFDYAPSNVPGFNFSATYFDIAYRERIANPTLNFLSAFLNRDVFGAVILDNPSVMQVNDLVARLEQASGIFNLTGRPFNPSEIEAIFDDRLQNLSATNVRGLDFSVTYNHSTNFGDIGLLLNGNYMFEFANTVTPTSPEDDILDTFLNPIDFRFRAGANWRKSGLTIAAFATYQDSYTNNITDPETGIDSWTTVDLNVTYEIPASSNSVFNDTRLAFSVRNLFDQNPPTVSGDSSALLSGGLITPVAYDPANGSVLGRFISFELRKSF